MISIHILCRYADCDLHTDVQVLVDIFKLMAKLGNLEPFSNFVESQHFPPAPFKTDEEIVA